MYLELRVATCACMLAIASILDIKSREIPDKVWLIFGGFGALLTAIELLDYGVSSSRATSFSIHYAIGIALMSGIGYATYKTGLFGGADPKALVAIAVILPTTYGAGLFAFHDFAAFSTLSNALIVSTTAMLYNIIRNSLSVARGVRIFEGMSEGRVKRALAFAVGFPSSSPGKYVFAMEAIDGSGNRKFRFNPANYADFVSPEEQWQQKEEEDEESKRRKRTWVTPALPFIVYIGIGFAINLTVGDLFALLLKLIL